MRATKVCPNCGKTFETELDRQHPEMRIQEEFPNAPAWQREQFLSGICSDKCWKEFLGMDDDEDEPTGEDEDGIIDLGL